MGSESIETSLFHLRMLTVLCFVLCICLHFSLCVRHCCIYGFDTSKKSFRKKFKGMFVSCGMIKYFSVVFSRVPSGDGLSIKNKFPLLSCIHGCVQLLL